MAETMVTRVADAIAAGLETEFPGAGYHGDEFLDLARKVLAAMAEPSEAMVNAGFDHIGSPYHIWRAMISAAMAERQTD